MIGFLNDVQYSFRQLRKTPLFTFTAIVSLALGIGATTAVFSVVYAVLLDPYPYKDSDRLAHLVVREKEKDRPFWPSLTGPQYQQLTKTPCLESVSGEDQWNLMTTDGDIPEDVNAVIFTPNAFQHFGLPTQLGRGLVPSDAPSGQDPQPVVVLGHKFWQRHFGGDPEVIGRTLHLTHKPYTIVGVTQRRFTWGDGDVYLPYKLTADPARQLSTNLRLKPGVTRAAASAELQPLIEQFAKETPKHFPEGGFRVRVQGLNEQFVERLGSTLVLLFGAVALLLVIGCANVSILLLARGTARQHELAIRAAVGGSRQRIVRQLLTESVTLSIAGCALGVVLAYRIVAFIATWLPEYSFPHEAAIHINLPVLGFSVALAMLTGILFGLSPALQLSRPELAEVMRASARKVTGGVRGKRTHGLLVASQIALTLLLLTAAAGSAAGFYQLMKTKLGYDPHNTMSVGVPIHENTFKTWAERSAYFEQIKAKIATMPEAAEVAISTNATPPDNGWQSKIEIIGSTSVTKPDARLNFISPEYFRLLRIPLVQGRIWDQAETLRGAPVAVINQTMAHQYWPDRDPMGQQIKLPMNRGNEPFQLPSASAFSEMRIIGVVADALDDGLRKPVKPAVYLPYTIMMPMMTQFLIRSHVPPLTILRSVRARIKEVNADQQAFSDVRDLEQWIARTPEWAQERLLAALFSAFALVALALAAIGLYSVVSYTVAQRTNEFGIRMALGAQPSHVLELVFRSTAVSVGAGLIAGLVISLGLNQVIAKWVPSGAANPLLLLGVLALLAAVAALACFLPARRAASIEPTAALRSE